VAAGGRQHGVVCGLVRGDQAGAVVAPRLAVEVGDGPSGLPDQVDAGDGVPRIRPHVGEGGLDRPGGDPGQRRLGEFLGPEKWLGRVDSREEERP
jgi:hypothetical protein